MPIVNWPEGVNSAEYGILCRIFPMLENKNSIDDFMPTCQQLKRKYLPTIKKKFCQEASYTTGIGTAAASLAESYTTDNGAATSLAESYTTGNSAAASLAAEGCIFSFVPFLVWLIAMLAYMFVYAPFISRFKFVY